MRILLPMVLALGFLTSAVSDSAQTGNTPNASSATVATADVPSDDPAFAGFLPVTGDIKPPKAISAPDPKYPQLPPDAEERGTVVMLIGVNTKGRVEAVHVLRSDEPGFEHSAVATVKKWRFKPAEKEGHPVPVQVTVEMRFQK